MVRIIIKLIKGNDIVLESYDNVDYVELMKDFVIINFKNSKSVVAYPTYNIIKVEEKHEET